MLSSDELQTELEELLRLFLSNSNQSQAKSLLSFVHRFGEEALEYINTQHPDAIPSMKALFDPPVS